MATLVWDDVGARIYETGVDRGVLYLPNGIGVPWNGLISVTEQSSVDSEGLYFDGVKYGSHRALSEFSATLAAYTYPDEFLEFEGVLYSNNGLYLANQPAKRFGLSYRTRVGNDIDGVDAGYKIHILYNLIAEPSERNYQSLSAETEVVDFQWEISAIPSEVPGFRPTAHLILDSRLMSATLLADIENTLYGDNVTDATLPPISTLVSFIGNWVIMRITDNLDGTWTVEGPDEFITMLSGTEFQITQANAVYLDVNTYNISDVTY